MKRGILVRNYLGARLIGKLNEVSARFPGSVMLVNRHGYFLRGRQPSDEWGFMFGNERTFKNEFPEAWQRIEAAAAEQFVTRDGMFTSRRLEMPARSASIAHVGERRDGAELRDRSRDSAMLVVAHVPNRVLYGKSTQLLQRLSIVFVVAVVLLSVLALYLARAGALRREHERKIEESEERLRLLSTRLLTAQEDERRSISRDVHDELGQVVTAITLDLERSTRLDGGEKRAKLIRSALDGTRCLLDKVHQISARVRPTMLDDLGLKEAVQSYLSEFERTSGIAVRADLQFEIRASDSRLNCNRAESAGRLKYVHGQRASDSRSAGGRSCPGARVARANSAGQRLDSCGGSGR
jgi:signal transduction histidine kinase